MQMVLNEIYLFYNTKLCWSLMRHFAYCILWIAHNLLSSRTTNHYQFAGFSYKSECIRMMLLHCLKTHTKLMIGQS
jgi:hypothetical protein